MRWLISWAWNTNPNDKDALVGAPKWLNEVNYDILAKVAPDQQAKTKGAPQIDFDELQTMMRTLATERFQMKAHMEDRVTDAYTLVAVNPKIKKADQETRPRSQGKSRPGRQKIRGSRTLFSAGFFRARTCPWRSSEMHCEIWPTGISTPGLKGGYDFTLSFSSIGQLRSGPAGATDSNPVNQAGASDPNGGLAV
jgi:uncharacterized protein (TIGR03435 family)